MNSNWKGITALIALLLIAVLVWWQFGANSSPTDATSPPEVAERVQGAEREKSNASTGEDREVVATKDRPEAGTGSNPTGALRVRVVFGDDQTRAPDVGVSVRAIWRVGPVPRRIHAKTEARGEAIFASLTPGEVTVRLNRNYASERTTIVAGKETELTMTLKDGIDVSGVVVDHSGTPVAGATIVLAGSGAFFPRVAGRADARGRFHLRQIERMNNIGARAKGHAPSLLRSVNAPAGSKLEIRITLPGVGGSVLGTVLNPDGRPIAGAQVSVGKKPPDGVVVSLPDGAHGMNTPRFELETDSTGKFVAHGVKPGTVPVSASTSSLAPWRVTVEVVAHVDSHLTIHLTHGVSVAGTVTDETGKPLPEIVVSGGGRRSARTDDAGKYRIEGLPTGAIRLAIDSSKQGKLKTTLHGGAGETLRWDPKLSRGLMLRGTVLGQDRKPLARVMIKASKKSVPGQKGWWSHVGTDADGRFEIIGCPTGPVVELRLEAKGYATLDKLGVDAAAGPLELQMQFEGVPNAKIIGQVLDPDGEPIVNATLSVLRRGAIGSWVYTTKAEGRIDLENQRPGSYRVIVRAGSYPRFMTEERVLGPNDTWDLGIVQLVHGGRMEVTVTLPKGSQEERFYLNLYQGGLRAARFDSRKRPIRSDPVAPGAYDLVVSGKAAIPQRIPVVIEAGNVVQQAISVQFGRPIELRFELPAGTDDVKLVTMSLTNSKGFRCERTSRRRSTAFRTFLGVTPGHYSIAASTPAGHAATLQFEVEPGKTVQKVTVRLR